MVRTPVGSGRTVTTSSSSSEKGASDVASDAGWWNDLTATVGMQLERFVDDNLRIAVEHEADPTVDP